MKNFKSKMSRTYGYMNEEAPSHRLNWDLNSRGGSCIPVYLGGIQEKKSGYEFKILVLKPY